MAVMGIYPADMNRVYPPQELDASRTGMADAGKVTGVAGIAGVANAEGMPGIGRVQQGMPVWNVSEAEEKEDVGRTQPSECETCKKRKYMDSSDEANVSFQAPTHLDPKEAGVRVMAHEREHVRNAVNEGQEANKRLVSVSVSLKTGICPECGRTYIAGGLTHTRMLTYRPNPYDQSRKSVEGTVLRGMNINKKI